MTILKHLLIAIFSLLVLFACTEKDDDNNLNENPPCESNFMLDLGNDIVFHDSTSFPVTITADSGAEKYSWSTGDTTNEVSVSMIGTYWVDAMDECGDVHSDTINVMIDYSTVLIHTDFGGIRIWLYDQTPLHKANFLGLTNDHYYDDVIFHRVVENFVIQGGDPDGTGFGGPGYTIPAEIIPGLNHVFGAVGAARQPDNVNPDKESHGSQFYIVCDTGGEPNLNGEYTVFGIVFEGLDVVTEISQVPVDDDDKPLEDVVMNNVTVEYFSADQLLNQFGFEIP